MVYTGDKTLRWKVNPSTFFIIFFLLVSFKLLHCKISIISFERDIYNYKISFIKAYYIPSKEIRNFSKIGILINLYNDANEVYFNGFKIGYEGSLKNHFVIAPCSVSVYEIPKNLIKFHEKNLILIKVLNLFYKSGFSKSPIVIDNYWKLYYKKEKKIQVYKFTECVLFSILIIILLITFFIYLKRKENIYLFAGIIIIDYLIVLILESSFFFSSGLKYYFLQKISLSLFSLLPLFLMLFLKEFLKERFNKIEKILIYASIMLSIVALIFLDLKNSQIFFNLWVFFCCFYIGYYIVLLFKAFKRKIPNFYVVCFIVLFFILSITLGNMFAIYNLTFENFFMALYPYDYGVLTFIAGFTYITISRFLKFTRERKELATKILNAQEIERKKIASELHDSIGQDLLTIKFNLQKIRDNCKVSELKNAINELDDTINNVRNIAMGLRPAILDRLGIESTIKYYSDKFKERTGINITFKSNLLNRPNLLVEENLFRIFQECMNNILKHARAKNIEISLTEKKKLFVLEIKDDGMGFNYEKAFSDKKGLGLSIIKDRVTLMNGRLYVNSKKRKGTTISIEVPYD